MKKRGEIWWVNFDPSVGQEIQKTRPAIIVSNNKSNRFLARYQVVPASTQSGKIYPGEAEIQISGKEGRAMIDQITTVSELRFKNKIGKVTKEDMERIEEVLKFQLGLK